MWLSYPFFSSLLELHWRLINQKEKSWYLALCWHNQNRYECTSVQHLISSGEGFYVHQGSATLQNTNKNCSEGKKIVENCEL